MGASSNNDNDDTISAINVTPFVDIILVVLIIFMVTTPIIMKPSINVNLPKAASGDETSAAPLNISISAAGAIFLNGKPASEEELKNYSADLIKQKPDAQAIISADKDVPHGKVITVIDSVKSGGIHKFAISIDKK
ncbi:MAG TPA: biopolymer transporter ExbD [Bdellovibrionales bacterium]|nr:biopolymer transporter ExbD [Bdellovibrionales bacterium]